jgi:dolichol-phosphate mannosyltransferase
MALAPQHVANLVAVCTYNERANVDELTERILAALPDCHLLFVDDDSPDGTSDWIRDKMQSEPRLRLIVRRGQRGLGGATRTALKYAVDHRYDFVMNLDGDLSHDPGVLPRMLAIAKEREDIDIVVGSRYIEDGEIKGWPWRRRIMSRFVNRFATSILRLPVADCSGSMRCYRVATLQQIDPATLKSESYAILEEILVRFAAHGSRMIETPIQFVDRTRGSSKLTMREAMRSVWQLVRVARTRERSRPGTSCAPARE